VVKLLLSLSILIGLLATPTSIAEDLPAWKEDCFKISQSFFPITYQNEALQFKVSVIEKRKKLKADLRLVKKLEKFESTINSINTLDCSKLTEAFWSQIREDRISKIESANEQMKLLLGEIQIRKDKEITCYKDGGAKIVKGKNPKCPIGFEIVPNQT
jgi:hypothetical protein